MPLIGFTVRLDSIEENLLYKAQDSSYWLSGVCTFDQDAKGRDRGAVCFQGKICGRRERPAGGLLAGDWQQG